MTFRPAPTSNVTEDPKDLLRKVIESSGLSARRWAEDVAWRDERTVRRWINGDSPIPEIVVQKLRALVMRSPR